MTEHFFATKLIHVSLLERRITEPRVAQLHPELDFMLTWKNLGGSGLSQTALDFEFRAIH